MEEMKERSSESHPSSLEDGRVVTDFDKVKFCQSCGMPLTDDVLGTNATVVRTKIIACTAIRMENSCRIARWKR